ncbi:hypothetical protein NYT31_05075 [Staphylococcus aureus]|uniref:hypothetical protein n=1 Tax=Staphylococcus aureus TaxID=1280 RepID=UPI002175ED5D|nr:hypothetical protein [Staphylococcus aureus]MCS5353976.1 hypothetical protein [Staphylococcus aureus]MCS5429405.1 hypothetical protein [Staphylococcus aureus]MDG6489113.1 hypothetical protein [Staphylococcus aureus]HCZ1028843.1 hypothetical protein [Staphylococcus aureus]HDE0410147.1 hypothetical protein [Staphylococcus aureus]
MRVGVGPNTEADGKPAYNNCGAPTQRISKRNSTNNASWGAGPQHREIGFQISTDNGSWGVTTK